MKRIVWDQPERIMRFVAERTDEKEYLDYTALGLERNPNDTMFPQALQTMASWAKAGELAGTARANFYQQFKQNNGGVSNLDQADQTWRNNFDPKIFQLQTYAPAQQQTLLNSLSPQQAQQLMQKRAWFKENGLLQ